MLRGEEDRGLSTGIVTGIKIPFHGRLLSAESVPHPAGKHAADVSGKAYSGTQGLQHFLNIDAGTTRNE